MSGVKFERQIRNFAKKTPEKAFRAIRGASFVAYRDIVSETPRKTGHAKRGWKIKIVKRGEFHVLIYNMVFYIKYLAQGSSPQAAKGWIDAILDKIPGNVKRLAK